MIDATDFIRQDFVVYPVPTHFFKGLDNEQHMCCIWKVKRFPSRETRPRGDILKNNYSGARL